MKRNFIYGIIIIILIVLCFGFWYIRPYLFEQQANSQDTDNRIVEQTEQSNLDANKNNKVMLADILKDTDEIVITEDNIDNTDKILSRAELKNGVFIVNSSREKFLQIINTVTNANYSIDEKGYLQKPINVNIKSDIIDKFNNLIDSDKTLVLNISNTYKGLLNDNMFLDFMIERTMYVQTFDYNESIKIALINPDRLEEKSEDLTLKEIYEEVLLGI